MRSTDFDSLTAPRGIAGRSYRQRSRALRPLGVTRAAMDLSARPPRGGLSHLSHGGNVSPTQGQMARRNGYLDHAAGFPHMADGGSVRELAAELYPQYLSDKIPAMGEKGIEDFRRYLMELEEARWRDERGSRPIPTRFAVADEGVRRRLSGAQAARESEAMSPLARWRAERAAAAAYRPPTEEPVYGESIKDMLLDPSNAIANIGKSAAGRLGGGALGALYAPEAAAPTIPGKRWHGYRDAWGYQIPEQRGLSLADIMGLVSPGYKIARAVMAGD